MKSFSKEFFGFQTCFLVAFVKAEDRAACENGFKNVPSARAVNFD